MITHYRIMFVQAVQVRRMFREAGESLFVEIDGRSEESVSLLEYVRVSTWVGKGIPTYLISMLEKLDSPPCL